MHNQTIVFIVHYGHSPRLFSSHTSEHVVPITDDNTFSKCDTIGERRTLLQLLLLVPSCFVICPTELAKIRKTLIHNSQSQGGIFDPRLPKYEVSALITWSRRLV